MNGPTNQLVDNTYRGQEAVTTAVRVWTDAVQNYAGSLYSGQFPLPNVQAGVNAGFDLATQLLTLQRDVVNTWLNAGTATGEAGETVTQAGETVAEQVRGGAKDAPSTPPSSTENTKRPRAERTRSV
jgi:hypothetical protein